MRVSVERGAHFKPSTRIWKLEIGVNFGERSTLKLFHSHLLVSKRKERRLTPSRHQETREKVWTLNVVFVRTNLNLFHSSSHLLFAPSALWLWLPANLSFSLSRELKAFLLARIFFKDDQREGANLTLCLFVLTWTFSTASLTSSFPTYTLFPASEKRGGAKRREEARK